MINSYFRKYEYKIQKYSWVKGWGVGWQLQRFREPKGSRKKSYSLIGWAIKALPP